jgi:endonuclease YncB( thermonuclease family)
MEQFFGIVILLLIFFWLVGGKKKPYKNRRKQYKQRKSYSSNRKKLKPKINPTSFKPFSGVAHVIDGDTIKIRGMKIRLAGINAPELDRPYGVKSKYEMVKIVKGKTVYVVPDGTTSYDRIVATCYVDGDVDIGAELVRRGLALDIPSFTGGKYTELETKEARRRIKNVPYRVKAAKAKQPVPEIEIDDDLVIDDDDNLDLINHGDK